MACSGDPFVGKATHAGDDDGQGQDKPMGVTEPSARSRYALKAIPRPAVVQTLEDKSHGTMRDIHPASSPPSRHSRAASPNPTSHVSDEGMLKLSGLRFGPKV